MCEISEVLYCMCVCLDWLVSSQCFYIKVINRISYIALVDLVCLIVCSWWWLLGSCTGDYRMIFVLGILSLICGVDFSWSVFGLGFSSDHYL